MSDIPPSSRVPPLTLARIAGPRSEVFPVRLTEEEAVFGRSQACDVKLGGELSVSRRHARFRWFGGSWTVTDLGSRHGVVVNAIRIEPERVTPIEDGDVVAIGPWSLRVSIGDETGTSRRGSTVDDTRDSAGIHTVAPSAIESLSRDRLAALLRYSETVASEREEISLAERTVEAVLGAAPFRRGAVLRPLGGGTDIEIVASRGDNGETVFSRALVRAAQESGVAELASDDSPVTSESIVRMGIARAVCVRVDAGETPVALLYFDSDRSQAGTDETGFVSAVARFYGAALGELLRRRLAQRQEIYEREAEQAREVQRSLMAASSGRVGRARYARAWRPGRGVAGDLFDIRPLEDGGVVFALGDVAGKGTGPGLLMASAVSYLHASMTRVGDLGAAVNGLHRYMLRHTADNTFLTLWIGAVGPDGAALRFIDAGHGYAVRIVPGRGGALASLISARGWPPIGVEHDWEYGVEQVAIRPGERVFLLSDGLVEQKSPDGEPFGVSRLLEALGSCADEGEDVERALAALSEHARSESFTDDVTIASVLIE